MFDSVTCTVDSESQAQAMTARLRTAGFSDADISLLFPYEAPDHRVELEQHTKAPEGVAVGVTTGGAVGAALGWLAGIGTLAIPGIGPLVAAGPILAALSGAAAGATVGGLTGTLVGLGMTEVEAKIYERKLQEGNFLVSVQCRDEHERDKAIEIFRAGKGRDISGPTRIIAGT
jgi:hypothetical protein